MKNILVLEDEANIRDFVVLNLKRSGYSVLEADTGERALEIAALNADLEIALLDVMLPGISGIEVAKSLRSTHPGIGIIMLTAKTQETDKVGGFMVGADDYVTKPFSPGELMARVDALYRRISYGRKKDNNVVVNGPFELNRETRTLTKNGTYIDLTQMEYLLIETMLCSKGVPMSRGAILEKVWGKNKNKTDEKMVDVNMRRLRLKIEEDPSDPKYLLTVWGLGYKWNTEE